MFPFTYATAVLEKLTPELQLLESSRDSFGFQMFLTLEPVFFGLFLFLLTFFL